MEKGPKPTVEKIEKVEEKPKVEEKQKPDGKKLNIKKVLPWIILALVVIGLSTWYVLSRRVSQTQLDSYNARIKQAEMNYKAKEYSTAINEYYEATEILPQRLDAYAGIIDILLLKNRADDAISITRKSTVALSADDRSHLYELLGNYFMDSQDYDKAREMYQEGLSIGVKNSNVELALGRAFLKLGRIEEAKRQVSIDGYGDENDSEANLLLSYILGVEDSKKAKEQIGKVSPTSKWTLFYDEYGKVLQTLDEDKNFNATKLARVYINSGYPYLALEVLRPISGDIANYLDANYYMARAYLDAKEYGKAIDTYDKVLTIGGKEADVYWGRARAYYGKNDLQAAIDNYSKAFGYMGKDITEDLLTEYIDILLKNNQDLKAVEVIRDVLINVEKPFVYLLGVRSNYQTGEKAKVDFYIQQLEKLELTEAQEKELLVWKIRGAIDTSNLESANTNLETLEAMDKYYPQYHLLSGIIRTKEGDTEGAKQSLERSIEYDLRNEVTEEATKLLSNLK